MTSAQLAWLAVTGGLAMAGCEPDTPVLGTESYVGTVSANWSFGSPLRVAYGRQWALGGDTEVDAKGVVRVPSAARVLIAYVDANHNGRLDRFAEPSGDCRLTGREWHCSIDPQRTTLHRSISQSGDARYDKTYVFWEDFAVNGSRVASSQLCIEHRCTSLEVSPFLSPSDAKVQVLSICGEQGFAPIDAEVRGSSQARTVPLAHPADLVAAVSVEATAGPPRAGHSADLRLQIATSEVDHVLVWAGHVDPTSRETQRVYWTSEDRGFELAEVPGGMTARLPSADVERCRRDPDCEIVVQILAYRSLPGAPVASRTEFRSTVAFRGEP